MPNKPLSMKEKEALAKGLGTGGANKAATAIIRRQKQNQAAAEDTPATAPQTDSLPTQKINRDLSGATKDYEMQKAIEMVRKAKTARRTAY